MRRSAILTHSAQIPFMCGACATITAHLTKPPRARNRFFKAAELREVRAAGVA